MSRIYRRSLKILNPFIFILNYCRYISHLESQRYCKHDEPRGENYYDNRYKRYDFSKDRRYF